MLKLAYPFKKELDKRFLETSYVEKYKYYNTDEYYNLEWGLSESTWRGLQFVSVDSDNNVCGYLSATIRRPERMISGMSVINFGIKDVLFAMDFKRFIDDLFTKHNFYKIQFAVVIGNPAEKMYDKFISKYGGNIVGVFHNSTTLWDGKFYDMKSYELSKVNYMENAYIPF